MLAIPSRVGAGALVTCGSNRLSPASIPSGRADDPRLGRLFTDSFDEASVVLIGFPHDEGCRRNGGRAGAALGPSMFRKFVTALGPTSNPERNIDLGNVRIFDWGDIVVREKRAPHDEGEYVSLEASHEKLQEAVNTVLHHGKTPFVIGGGNDQSAPNGRAALSFLEETMPGKGLGIINIDAHLDVRPKIDGKVHSGTPFRELLEDERVVRNQSGSRFVEFACQGQQCSVEHANFVTHHGGTLMWLTSLSTPRVSSFREALRVAGSPAFVSFDIDAVQGSDCPGVSCPASVGLSAQDALDICFAAGADPGVLLMDLSELNPAVEEYRSPRLAVMMFYHFLLGLATRR